MRSTFAVAALAAGAVAVPYQKRAVVTNYEIVYETAYVTVTAGGEPASIAPAAETSSVVQENNHYGHHGHGWGWPWRYTNEVQEETAQASEPEPTTPASTYVAPVTTRVVEAAEPTTEAQTPTQAYEAPTSEAAAPAPSSYQEPEPETSTQPAPAPSTEDSVGAAPTGYAEIATYHHNIHRANHSADPLEWDEELASCAAEIASSCVYAHNV